MTTAFDPAEIIDQVSSKLIEKYPDTDSATNAALLAALDSGSR